MENHLPSRLFDLSVKNRNNLFSFLIPDCDTEARVDEAFISEVTRSCEVIKSCEVTRSCEVARVGKVTKSCKVGEVLLIKPVK